MLQPFAGGPPPTGKADPWPQGWRTTPITSKNTNEEALQFLRGLLDVGCDATDGELACRLWKENGILVSRQTVNRVVNRMGYARKKTFFATERSSEPVNRLREEYAAAIATVDPARASFINETGTTLEIFRETREVLKVSGNRRASSAKR